MSKPTFSQAAPALVASLAFLLAPLAFAADALVKPVPVPDLSKLPPDKASELHDGRVEFEKLKPTLVGDPRAQAEAMLGALYARAGFYDVAAVALENAAALAPNDARWIYAQGIVARMQKEGQEFAIDSTPTFVFNGDKASKVPGALTFETLAKIIDQRLAAKK